MRITRTDKFKKQRRKKTARFLVVAVLLPCSCIFVGYLITLLFILPAMAK